MKDFSRPLFLLLMITLVAHTSARDVTSQFNNLPRSFYDFTPPARDEIGFDSSAYLEIAISLQELGPAEALKILRSLAKRSDGGKVILLCRMLYVARRNSEFRRPYLGGPTSLQRIDGHEWPLEPLAIVDGIPFLITMGYTLAGKPEAADSYLEYCISECDWNEFRYKQATAVEIENAYTKLLRSFQIKDRRTECFWVTFIRAQLQTAKP